jgi:hypothetical protein
VLRASTKSGLDRRSGQDRRAGDRRAGAQDSQSIGQSEDLRSQFEETLAGLKRVRERLARALEG